MVNFILHLLPLIYLIFNCLDPDPQRSEYGSNLDPDPQHGLKPKRKDGDRSIGKGRHISLVAKFIQLLAAQAVLPRSI